MKRYRIEYEYRNDGGMTYGMSTDRGVATIKANDIAEARGKAIDKVYAKHGNISHVHVVAARECGPGANIHPIPKNYDSYL